nr:MAG TPA: hypothetical protein [Caudoviricetes sp.]
MTCRDIYNMSKHDIREYIQSSPNESFCQGTSVLRGTVVLWGH